MTGFYDLMLMIDPNAPEERRTAAVSEAESLLSSGGEIVGSQDWGQRRMAYEIDHRPEAEYRLYQFNGDNALLDRLHQRLRINDAVLRFRIIKAKPGQPLPPPPEQQAARRREDREPQDTRVAARAAADAPAATDGSPEQDITDPGPPAAADDAGHTESSRPADDAGPAEGSRPADDAGPAEGTHPAADAAPTEGSRPADDAGHAEGTHPAADAAPTEGSPPADDPGDAEDTPAADTPADAPPAQ